MSRHALARAAHPLPLSSRPHRHRRTWWRTARLRRVVRLAVVNVAVAAAVALPARRAAQ